MRCPKCHYLGFDPEPRCKNCGYDLEVADADLALHASDTESDEPMPDLRLHERPNADAAPVTLELIHTGAKSRAAVMDADDRTGDRLSRFSVVEEPVDDPYEEPARQLEAEALADEQADEVDELDTIEQAEDAEEAGQADETEEAEPAIAAMSALPAPVAVVPQMPQPSAAVAPQPFRSAHTTELPLFVKGIGDNDLRTPLLLDADAEDAPIVPPTRPPLAVRRGAAEPSRPQPTPRIERRLGPLDHDLLEDLKRVEREEAARDRGHARPDEHAAAFDDRVEPGRRLAAAGIDVAFLGAIAAFVFWATLRLCNVSVSDVGWSALVPFLIFIAAVDLSYLLMFTAAGGQTVGKMLMNIRVVADAGAIDEPVPMGRAAWRAALTLVSVIALGLGWLPALFGRGLTLHDRLAHTRVVRA
jgi:uncharacterized RDD family membrane protein YckC